MDESYLEEVMYYTSDEFSDRICPAGQKPKTVTWEELNDQYNDSKYNPVDGKLVRICDHLSALMEADISIKHGITSSHLQGGKDGMLELYPEETLISGIDVNKLFHELVY